MYTLKRAYVRYIRALSYKQRATLAIVSPFVIGLIWVICQYLYMHTNNLYTATYTIVKTHVVTNCIEYEGYTNYYGIYHYDASLTCDDKEVSLLSTVSPGSTYMFTYKPDHTKTMRITAISEVQD